MAERIIMFLDTCRDLGCYNWTSRTEGFVGISSTLGGGTGGQMSHDHWSCDDALVGARGAGAPACPLIIYCIQS
jgi:hypothetical protein